MVEAFTGIFILPTQVRASNATGRNVVVRRVFDIHQFFPCTWHYSYPLLKLYVSLACWKVFRNLEKCVLTMVTACLVMYFRSSLPVLEFSNMCLSISVPP